MDNRIDYGFSKEVALKFGINSAMILNRMIWSINIHEQNNESRFFIDDRWWMYDSFAALTKHFDGLFDDGACNVSSLSILELTSYYPSLTVNDFAERGNSSYTLVGDKFTLMPPSIQNPVAISSSSGTIGGSIVVQDTTYFPSEGYLFTSGGTVIQYTGKSSIEFTGCTLYSGPNSINATEELVPFTIS